MWNCRPHAVWMFWVILGIYTGCCCCTSIRRNNLKTEKQLERLGNKTFFILVSCMDFLRFEGQCSFSYYFLYVVRMLVSCPGDALIFQMDVSNIVQKTLVTQAKRCNALWRWKKKYGFSSVIMPGGSIIFSRTCFCKACFSLSYTIRTGKQKSGHWSFLEKHAPNAGSLV